MSFEPIESQEQLDAIIKDRVERAKKSAIKETEERYTDYEAVKKKAEEAGQMAKEKDNRIKELEKAQADMEKAKAQELADLQSKISGLEMEAQKIRIANEAGLPLELAGRLTGEDAEALKADAETLKGMMKGKGGAPLGSYEEAPKDGNDQRNALAGMLDSMWSQKD